jgi:hypothetical protein
MNAGMKKRERRGQRLASGEFVEEKENRKSRGIRSAPKIFFSYLQFFFLALRKSG